MKCRRFTPAARADLLGIWDYIAARNVAAADRVAAAISLATRRLARTPQIGQLRPDLAPDTHRFLTVRPYLVVYRVTDDAIEILRGLRGARNVRRVLAEEE